MYYALHNREMVIRRDSQPLTLEDLQALRIDPAWDLFTEAANDLTCLALGDTEHLPEAYTTCLIREHFYASDEAETFRTARAKALIGWRETTHYCGRCGTALQDHESMTARVCPKCGQLIFPRIEPCVITVVRRADGKILLARHVQRNQDIYACIAGFMEAGETAEQAVAREVMEETGLRIRNIRYFGSQSWPFPAQLMLGFTAEYDGGEIHLQEEELSDARWFDRDNCPASPAPGSIAWRLIHES